MVHVGSQQRSVDRFYFREVEIPANGTRTLDLPPLSASLAASLPYETDEGQSRRERGPANDADLG